MTTGTPADTSGAFFADNPFGNVIAVPTQTTSGLGAGNSFISGAIDCSQFQGARFSFRNNAGGDQFIVILRYFDDQNLTNDVGERWWLVTAGQGAFLNTTQPHLSDWLQIQLAPFAGSLNVTWSVAHRQNAISQWNLTPQFVLARPTTPTNVLQFGVNVALPAGTTNLETNQNGGNGGVYSGPAHLWLATPLTTGVNVFIQQRDLNNTYQTNVMVRTDANGIANLDYLHWPMGIGTDIRIHAVNGGAASTLSWTITADEYRIGG